MKRQIGFGDACAGGQPPFNDGRHYKDGACTLCHRPVLRWSDGHVKPHPWELKGPNVKPGDTSTNSAANRAERARQRVRGA